MFKNFLHEEDKSKDKSTKIKLPSVNESIKEALEQREKIMFERIIKWNKERNLIPDKPKEISELWNELDMLEEEMQELSDANDMNEYIDALCDVIVVATGAIRKAGYDPYVAMDETLKEIESRTGEIDLNGKFQKCKTEECKKKWYKADYDKAKIPTPYISGFEPES